MREEREKTYRQLHEAIEYAHRCNASGDGAGEDITLYHSIDLIGELRKSVGSADEADTAPAPAPEVKPARRMKAEQPPSDAGKRVRGHVPKGGHAKRFRLFEAVDGAWEAVAVGTAAELANEHGVTAAQVYALARKEGSTTLDGRYRCEEVIG